MADDGVVSAWVVMRRLGISRSTLARRVRAGKFVPLDTGGRVLRFDWAQIQAALRPRKARV